MCILQAQETGLSLTLLPDLPLEATCSSLQHLERTYYQGELAGDFSVAQPQEQRPLAVLESQAWPVEQGAWAVS